MAGEIREPFDPSSYSYQEMIGQVPSFIRLGPLRVYAGQGVPSASLGANGDVYIRQDGTAGANNKFYSKDAGVWVGLTA